MPFVNIRIYAGHGKERKDEIARRVGGDRGHRPARLVRGRKAWGADGEVSVEIREPRFASVDPMSGRWTCCRACGTS